MRDPLAVADVRSIAAEDLAPFEYRQPGANGEFVTEALALRASEKVKEQKWYWLPQQKPDEVLVIKLADSEAGIDGVAGGTPHGSPRLQGTEGEEARESIEVRVAAFW